MEIKLQLFVMPSQLRFIFAVELSLYVLLIEHAIFTELYNLRHLNLLLTSGYHKYIKIMRMLTCISTVFVYDYLLIVYLVYTYAPFMI